MRDYTLDEKDKQNFLLNYKIENKNNDKKIVAKYANGDTISIPYSRQRELAFLNIMRAQVEKCNIDKVIEEKRKFLVFYSILYIISNIELYTNRNEMISDYKAVLYAAINIVAITAFVKNVSNTITLRKEYEKNKYFLENEELINKHFYHKIYSDEIEPIYNINNIERLDIKSLKRIVNDASELENNPKFNR